MVASIKVTGPSFVSFAVEGLCAQDQSPSLWEVDAELISFSVDP